MTKNIDVLLVDDNQDDIDLTKEALTASKIHVNSLNVLNDGVEAMEYLRREGQYKNSIRPLCNLFGLKHAEERWTGSTRRIESRS